MKSYLCYLFFGVHDGLTQDCNGKQHLYTGNKIKYARLIRYNNRVGTLMENLSNGNINVSTPFFRCTMCTPINFHLGRLMLPRLKWINVVQW